MRVKHKPTLLFEDSDKAEIFLKLIDDELHRDIADRLFVRGDTNKDVADAVGYSVRQIERIRVQILKDAVTRAVNRFYVLGGMFV